MVLADGGGLLVIVLLLSRLIPAPGRDATEKLQSARRIVDDLYLQVARSWPARELGDDDLLRAFLLCTVDLHEVLAEERSAISRWSGLAHFHAGQVFHRALRNEVEAERSYLEAIAIQERVCERYPLVAVYRQDLAETRHWQRVLLRERGLHLPVAEQLDERVPGQQDQLPAETVAEPEERTCNGRGGPLAVIVFAGSSVEAYMVCSFLVSNGITPHLDDELTGLVAPPYAAAGGAGAVKVLVAREEAQRAQELLAGRPTEPFHYPCQDQ
jgi:hypothetical protein